LMGKNLKKSTGQKKKKVPLVTRQFLTIKVEKKHKKEWRKKWKGTHGRCILQKILKKRDGGGTAQFCPLRSHYPWLY